MSKNSFSATKGNYVREKMEDGMSNKDARDSFHPHEHGFLTKAEHMIEKAGSNYDENEADKNLED